MLPRSAATLTMASQSSLSSIDIMKSGLKSCSSSCSWQFSYLSGNEFSAPSQLFTAHLTKLVVRNFILCLLVWFGVVVVGAERCRNVRREKDSRPCSDRL